MMPFRRARLSYRHRNAARREPSGICNGLTSWWLACETDAVQHRFYRAGCPRQAELCLCSSTMRRGPP